MKILSVINLKTKPHLRGVLVGLLTFVVTVFLAELLSTYISTTQLSYEKSLGSESIRTQLAKGSVIAIGFQILQFLLLEVNFFVALIVGWVAGYAVGDKGGKIGLKTAIAIFSLAVLLWLLVRQSADSRTDLIRFVVTFPRFAVLAYIGGHWGELWFRKNKAK